MINLIEASLTGSKNCSNIKTFHISAMTAMKTNNNV